MDRIRMPAALIALSLVFVGVSATPAAAAEYTVTASRLNVRTGPSTRYRVIGQLSRGQRVNTTGASGAWRKIRFAGRDAWVHGGYLRGSGAPAPQTRAVSRAGFIQLAASGPGFYSYTVASRRWGRPELVYGIERAGQVMRARGGRPRFGVGDLSLQNGGDISGHRSHETGRDADIRPMRRDGREGPVTRFQRAYSRGLTRELIRELKTQVRERVVLFNDLFVGGVVPFPGHDNHFHLSIR